MGREKTGKRYKSFDDLERRWPRIPAGLIATWQIPGAFPIGIYGSNCYGMCVYGISHGYYSISSYDDCYYQPAPDGVYGSHDYGDCNYN